MRLSKKAAAAAVTAAVVLGGAGAAAWATSGSSSAPSLADTASTTTTTAAPRHPGLGLLRRADHGDLEVRIGGQWQTVTFDRGRATSVSATSITVQRPDGQSVTLAITPATKFAGVSSWQQVRLQAPVAVASRDGSALRVAQRATAATPGAGPAATPAA